MYAERVVGGGKAMNQKRIRTDCMIRDSYQRLIENSEEDALERELKAEIEKQLKQPSHMAGALPGINPRP